MRYHGMAWKLEDMNKNGQQKLIKVTDENED